MTKKQNVINLFLLIAICVTVFFQYKLIKQQKSFEKVLNIKHADDLKLFELNIQHLMDFSKKSSKHGKKVDEAIRLVKEYHNLNGHKYDQVLILSYLDKLQKIDSLFKIDFRINESSLSLINRSLSKYINNTNLGYKCCDFAMVVYDVLILEKDSLLISCVPFDNYTTSDIVFYDKNKKISNNSPFTFEGDKININAQITNPANGITRKINYER